MPNDKLQQLAVKFEVDIANISEKDAKQLCEYLADYLVKHYVIVNYSYHVKYGE